MATLSLAHEVTYGNTTIRKTADFTGGLVTLLDGETVANGQTDQQIVLTLDVSAVKGFFLVSDQAVTVETNNGAAPADTLTLVANYPYVWSTSSYDTFQLGTDVTSLYITNASGSTATLYMYAVIDATP